MGRAIGFLPTHKLGYGDPQVVIQIATYTQDTFERIGDQIRKFVNTRHHDMGLPQTVDDETPMNQVSENLCET